MCWWWSAVFFDTIIQQHNLGHRVTEGPLSKKYGSAGKCRMVGTNGELTIVPEDDFVVQALCAALESQETMECSTGEAVVDEAK
jgi:hypothetical protein